MGQCWKRVRIAFTNNFVQKISFSKLPVGHPASITSLHNHTVIKTNTKTLKIYFDPLRWGREFQVVLVSFFLIVKTVLSMNRERTSHSHMALLSRNLQDAHLCKCEMFLTDSVQEVPNSDSITPYRIKTLLPLGKTCKPRADISVYQCCSDAAKPLEIYLTIRLCLSPSWFWKTLKLSL